MVYLDNAATTLIKPSAVAESVRSAINSLSSPGRGGHKAAMAAADKLFECREEAAKLFNVKNPENVVFTFNATHALNIAINSIIKPGSKIIVSGYEHNSVIRPIYSSKADLRIVRTKLFDRKLILEGFKNEINKGASLVVCTHVSNVFGFIMPVKEISEICKERKIPFIIDASQSAGSEIVDFENLGASYVAIPGHKGLYGPQGTGMLLCRYNGKPILFGGTGSHSAKLDMPNFLPDRLEAGTHNTHGIAGLLEGIRFVNRIGASDIKEHERDLIDLAHSRLSKIKNIVLFFTENREAQSGVMSFIIKGKSSEETAEDLSRLEIATRAGLHCAPVAHTTVGTVKTGTVRISLSAFSKDQDIFALEDALKYLVS